MDRRRFLINVSLSAAALITSQSLFKKLSLDRSPIFPNDIGTQDFYVGTYGIGQNGGIYFCRLDLKSGEIILRGETKAIDNPSFLAIDSSKHFLFAVNEIMKSESYPGGSVSSFAISRENGSLKFINTQPTLGGSPCYISIDPANNFLLVTNYSAGSIIVFPILDGANIGKNVDFIQNKGHSLDSERQESPHPHSIILSPDNRYAYVPDLGLDKILIYRFNKETGNLVSNPIPFVSLKSGAGPRHITFHPDGKFTYVINELNSTITVYRYKSLNGKLIEIQTVPTLPDAFEGVNYCADIHVHPNGKFLYGSNRGHNSIVWFKIDPARGKLELKGFTSTQGDFPRNFAIDPSGQYLLAANQRSNNIISLKINNETGELSPTGYSVEISQPVCIRFLN